MKRNPNQGPAPALAAEEQQRGDNMSQQIEFRSALGLPVELHQMAARDAYETAAAHGEQPDRGCLS